MSRIRILALLAILVAMATTFAACGGSDDGGGDPQQRIEDATLEGVESGEVELSLDVNAEGKEGGEVEVELSGPFEVGAKGELPQAQLSAAAKGNAKGDDIDFEGGLTLLKDRAFIAYEGDDYEVDPTTFGFLKSTFEQAEQEGGEEADVTACQQAAEGIKFAQLAEDLTEEDGGDVGGVSTTKLSGDLDVSGTADALIQLTEDPACSSQLEAAGPLLLDQLHEAKEELTKAIKDPHLELWVGDDDIIRKVVAELTVEPPDANKEKVELDLELTLNEVNEEQSFSTPTATKPLEALFKLLGVNPLELLEAGRNGGLNGLLEELEGSFGGGGSEGSSSGGGGGANAGGDRTAYVECLQEAETAPDLQKCASLLK